MSYSEIQQQQHMNSFYTNVQNIVQRTNTNFNVGVRVARENEVSDQNDTMGKCAKNSEGKYKAGTTKTAPMLLVKPSNVWGSVLAHGQRSIIAIMAQATMAQVKESSNFWGALFKCSQNQLTEQVKMAPAIAKFQIAKANQTADATRAQAKSALEQGRWMIGALVGAVVLGAAAGASTAYSTEAEATEDANTAAAANQSTLNGQGNGAAGNAINTNQNPAALLRKAQRLQSWGGRFMNYGSKMLSKAVFSAQVAGQAAQGMSQLTVQSKYLKIQAQHQANAGRAEAASTEIQTLAQAAGTQSNQQFQLASQTEQNGISGFLQTLSQAANGLAQAIGGVLSVR